MLPLSRSLSSRRSRGDGGIILSSSDLMIFPSSIPRSACQSSRTMHGPKADTSWYLVANTHQLATQSRAKPVTEKLSDGFEFVLETQISDIEMLDCSRIHTHESLAQIEESWSSNLQVRLHVICLRPMEHTLEMCAKDADLLTHARLWHMASTSVSPVVVDHAAM